MQIVLATDGSKCSQSAEQFLASFPFAEPPELTIVTASPQAQSHPLAASVPDSVNDLVASHRVGATQQLNEAKERCRAWARSVETVQLEGHPATEILKYVDEHTPDLIAVGARGKGAIRRFLLGSTSERIAKHAPTSVLVVRADQDSIQSQRILIADDGSSAAQRAIQRFAELPLGDAREVCLLSVIETMPEYGMESALEAEPAWEQHLAEVTTSLQEHAERIKAVTPNVDVIVHKSSDPSDCILDVAEERGTHLIVAGGTGKGEWQRLLLGSSSLRILQHAPCSVWIEREKATAG